MFDCIIVGAGPAGISASLYLARANKKVLVLYYNEAQVEKAHKIDNYYGFVDGISGNDLYNNGIKQAINLGVDVLQEEVLDIKIDMDMHYQVNTLNNQYKSKTLIIATGNKKLRPNIKGIVEFEGKGISYCAICDGFFYRKKKLAVLGASEYAISEANELNNITDDITILSNGEKLNGSTKFNVIDKKIKEIKGDVKIRNIEFEDGSTFELDGLFIAIGSAGGIDFAKKLGLMVENDNIVVDENMKTNIDGLYACGNITGGLLQVGKAVYEGSMAGLSAIKYINENK